MTTQLLNNIGSAFTRVRNAEAELRDALEDLRGSWKSDVPGTVRGRIQEILRKSNECKGLLSKLYYELKSQQTN